MSKDVAPVAIIIGALIVLEAMGTAYLFSHPAAAAMLAQMPPPA
jgi:hypothetical protein